MVSDWLVIALWHDTALAVPIFKYPDSKIHGANMGPTWVLLALDGPHVGPMNLSISVCINKPVHIVNGKS